MDPSETSWRWQRWTATGDETAISKMSDLLDAHLPEGWRRLTRDELLPYGSLVWPKSRWYGVDAATRDGGVVLSIERTAPYQLRGGLVRSPGSPVPIGTEVLPASWDAVGRFLDEGVIPAARMAGASLRVPAIEEMFFSDLPFEVEDRLRKFSSAVKKALPLGSEQAELWREFVVAVFRMEARFDSEPFVRWLVSVGWPRKAAEDLYAQLVDDCLLLSRYAEGVSAA